MIALLLALAAPDPIACDQACRSKWFLSSECAMRTTEHCTLDGPSQHCDDRHCVDLLPGWNQRYVPRSVCLSEACELKRDEAHCIWHSDGTVEAKNATCKDREGTRP